MKQMNSAQSTSLGAADKVEIFSSRGRIVLLGFVSLLFVLLGLWMGFGGEASGIFSGGSWLVPTWESLFLVLACVMPRIG